MIESMCRSWYAVERRSNEDYDDLVQEQRDEVRRRVMLVLSGEVRYSECSPGDLRIWMGRARDRDWWEQCARQKFRREAFNDRDDCLKGEHRELKWANYWDTLGWMPNWSIQSGTRLFGNANIGNFNLCNLYVAGQTCGDQFFYSRSWYARMPFDEDVIEETNALLRCTHVSLTIGDRSMFTRLLVDLVDGCCDADIVIPPRQCFSVIVNIAHAPTLASLNEKLAARHHADPKQRPHWGFTIHLEGAESRASL